MSYVHSLAQHIWFPSYWSLHPSFYYGKTSDMLGRWNDFRTFSWIENIQYPEQLIDKTQKLLGIVA